MKLFGLEITKDRDEDKKLDSVSPPIPDGGIDVELGVSGNNNYFFDFDVNIRDEVELINSYRGIAKISEVDSGIDEVINEAIVVQDQDEIVELSLGSTKFSEGIKKKIVDEFRYLLGLLNFHDQGDQIFRQWYIDGKHYYHKVVIENKQQDGIKELNWLDPTKTKKIREIERERKPGENAAEIVRVKEEYFLYDPALTNKKNSFQAAAYQEKQVLRLSPDAVAYTTSGLIDLDTGQVLSYLHKAIKPANQLSLVEDSMVVYRLTRAPERRIFYIDIGNLGHARAEAYVQSIMQKYKNKLVYDVTTGAVKASKAHLSMMEDIWLPRKEGGRGTEVDTLQAAANLGDIDDILYFRRRLFRALNVPPSRMDEESSLFSIGMSGEINRDEVKFSKYVDKIRRRFNTFFYDLLKTQLILKKILTEEDWKLNKSLIGFIYNRDSFISELQKAEMIRQRFELLQAAEEFTGQDRYLSQSWNRENILRMPDQDWIKIQKDWKDEPEPEPEAEEE